MASFRCPFCGNMMILNSKTYNKREFNFDSSVFVSDDDVPYLRVDIYRCPYDDCGKETVVINGVNGYIGDKVVWICPDSQANQYPDYIPIAIRDDYEEACSIVSKSPKAAATLARRCLQGIIRDFWGISKNRLIDEINELKGKIPAAQWTAINAVRSIGNIGAHMEKDVSLIVDVEQEEAVALIKLLELLMEKWYISRHDEEQLYNEIISIAAEKKQVKNL